MLRFTYDEFFFKHLYQPAHALSRDKAILSSCFYAAICFVTALTSKKRGQRICLDEKLPLIAYVTTWISFTCGDFTTLNVSKYIANVWFNPVK